MLLCPSLLAPVRLPLLEDGVWGIALHSPQRVKGEVGLPAPSGCRVPSCRQPWGPSAGMQEVGAEPSLCLPTGRPARFQEGLKDLEVLEGGAATLRCTLSSVATPVEWRRGDEVLQPGGKYSLRQEGTVLELVVRDLRPQDSGQYSCCFGDQMTLATLTVKGKHPCPHCPWAPFIPVGG